MEHFDNKQQTTIQIQNEIKALISKQQSQDLEEYLETHNVSSEILSSILLETVKNQKLDQFLCIQVLLQKQLDINVIDREKKTCLMYACMKGDYQIVDELIQQPNIKVDMKDSKGNTALYLAINKHFGDNSEVVSKILKETANVDEEFGENRYTVLFKAVECNYTKSIKAILQVKPNLDKQSQNGNTVLHMAVLNENLEIIRELINNGIDLNIRNNKGKVAIDLAKSSILKEEFKNIVDNKQEGEENKFRNIETEVKQKKNKKNKKKDREQKQEKEQNNEKLILEKQVSLKSLKSEQKLEIENQEESISTIPRAISQLENNLDDQILYSSSELQNQDTNTTSDQSQIHHILANNTQAIKELLEFADMESLSQYKQEFQEIMKNKQIMLNDLQKLKEQEKQIQELQEKQESLQKNLEKQKKIYKANQLEKKKKNIPKQTNTDLLSCNYQSSSQQIINSCFVDEKFAEMKLTKEIQKFSDEVMSFHQENKTKFGKLINDISEIIKQQFPGSSVTVYGSYVTELCLPWSNINLMVETQTNNTNMTNQGIYIIPQLEKIYNALKAHNIFKQDNYKLFSQKNCVYVPSLQIQCNKEFLHKQVNITIKTINHQGLEHNKLVNEYLQAYPEVKQIIHSVKHILYYNELHIEQHKGVGGYSVVYMVVYLVQQKLRTCMELPSLGRLLIDFFYFYGFTTNFFTLQIYCHKPGQYGEFPSFFQNNQFAKLTIIDPINPNNIIGHLSHNILKVQEIFTHAYMIVFQQFTCNLPCCQTKDPEFGQKNPCFILKRIFNSFRAQIQQNQ